MEQGGEEAEAERPGGQRNQPDHRQHQPGAPEIDAGHDQDDSGDRSKGPSGCALHEVKEWHRVTSAFGGSCEPLQIPQGVSGSSRGTREVFRACPDDHGLD